MKIGIIGLGYVGLPLFCNLSEHFEVLGVDISKRRVEELNFNKDLSGILSNKEISLLKKYSLNIYSEYKFLKECNVFIITVPTPVDKNKRPNLLPLEESVKSLLEFIKKKDLIILESTVYPGATKKYIIDVIEKETKWQCNKDFGVAYSPERVNPGDNQNKLENIVKVISASSEEYLEVVQNIYIKIIKAGLFKASSIETAEAAKIMENVQRDVNIAFMNEFEEILKKMNINIWEVIEAAKTKWNFLDFKPGLVGGHCIGVDPYYLIYESENRGYSPNLIRNAREINEKKVIIKSFNLLKKLSPIKNKKLLILGVTFKSNCADLRNSKVIEIINILNEFEIEISVFDPFIKKLEIPNINVLYDLKNIEDEFDLLCICVEHDFFSSKKCMDFLDKKFLHSKIVYLKNL